MTLPSNNRIFETLGHRIIFAYLVTMPGFVPITSLPVTLESQEAMHQFLENSIQKIFEQPMLVGIDTIPDEYYQNNEFLNEKPKLFQRMMAIEYKLVHFYHRLIRIGKEGLVDSSQMVVPKTNLKLSSKTWKNLENFGMILKESSQNWSLTCTNYPALFPAWKYLASLHVDGERNKMIHLLHSLYPGKEYTIAQMYGRAFSNPQLLEEMENFFRECGYKRRTDNLEITWIKEYPKKEKGQFTLSYNFSYQTPFRIEFKVPYFRRILNQFDSLDTEVKDLVFSRLRTCNACFYCVQYKKSGNKKLINQNLEFKGEKKTICPLFPSFSWTNLTPEMFEIVKRLYQFADL